jgi:protein-S-isoprenylcysteine O-methyltransferase Ste14
MNTARYLVAVLMLVTTPIAVGLWYVIHPFARYWRRIGPGWTYGILAVPAFLAGRALWVARDALLGPDLGTRPVLLAVIVPSPIAGAAIARSRRRQLTQRTLTGIPELSSRDKGRLVTEGIYARVRNPRYLEFLVFVLAYVAFANHLGTWVLYALMFPVLHGVVLLEERELRDRFGAEYEEYCRRVPRYVPRRRGA